MSRRCVVAAIWVLLVAPGSRGNDRWAFLESHCLSCHSGASAKGGLDLEALPKDLSDPATFTRWVRIHDRVASGEMPPATVRERPEAKAFLATLSADLIQAERAREASAGRAHLRRLTRTEYEAIIQDLFDLPGLPVAENLLPDGQSHGLDRTPEALELSPIHIARYLETAQFVLERAIATRPTAPIPYRRRLYPADQYPWFVGLEGGDCVLLKNGQRDPAWPLFENGLPKELTQYYINTVLRPSRGTVGCFRHDDEAFHPGFVQFCPLLPGRYRCRISLWSFFWNKGRVEASPRTQVVSVRSAHGYVAHFDAPSLKPTVYEFECWLEPNDLLRVNAASLENVHVYNMKGRAGAYVGPGVAIDWLEVEGPLHTIWPPISHQRLFGDLPLVPVPKGQPRPPRPDQPVTRRRDAAFPNNLNEHGLVDGVWTVHSAHPQTDARRLLRDFLTRAFRRPATEAEVRRYAALVNARLETDGFEGAMRQAYAAALCDPAFLYRVEESDKLSGHEIAFRLSLLLWNSVPDESLLAAARDGRLTRDRDELRRQLRRLWEDPRRERFIKDFLGQWWSLRDVPLNQPDAKLYPEFKPYMQDCMVEESHAFFRHLIDHDLGVRFLVDSDFAMLNAELAKLYGIADVPEGHAIGRVHLPPHSHRGGLLTQGAILKVTANGTTTSPVKRGAWVLDRLLGLPPDPPPPGIPAIEPDVRGAVTIRDQLARHRSHAACASCHARIDPPGFALESYDVIGRYRERYRTLGNGDRVDAMVGEGHYPVQYRLGPAVDCSGVSADGRAFANLEEFKTVLLQQERQIARNFLNRLTIYATGRPVRFADRPLIEAILDRADVKDERLRKAFGNYRMRTLLEEFIASDLFLKK